MEETETAFQKESAFERRYSWHFAATVDWVYFEMYFGQNIDVENFEAII